MGSLVRFPFRTSHETQLQQGDSLRLLGTRIRELDEEIRRLRRQRRQTVSIYKAMLASLLLWPMLPASDFPRDIEVDIAAYESSEEIDKLMW